MAKREAEKKQLEAAMAECNRTLESMREADPATAERLKKRLDELIKGNQKLPLAFKKQLFETARVFERNSNTRATHAALDQALKIARIDDAAERNRLISEARRFCNKAVSLGADVNFKAAANRKIEIIMLSGGVEHKGPTVAKPRDTAPKNPHNPKS
ncbi:MAG TPA: hypothetical protein VGL83_15600 [Stellaceae bacterium]